MRKNDEYLISSDVGDKIDLEKVEKTFILKEKDASEKFKMILEDIPKEIIYVC